MKSVKGKNVLITGGALGMGKELAKKFAKDGARIVLWDIRPQDLEKAAEEIKALGAECYTAVCDVTNREQVYQRAAEIKGKLGFIDIVDANAGIVYAGSFATLPDEKIAKTLEVNINGVIWTVKAFLPDMIAKDDGHIILMSSAAGLVGVGNLVTYCATKYAVLGLGDALRAELKNQGKRGVKITLVHPSFVKTGMFEGTKPPIFNPWLTTEQMTNKIYKACLRELVSIKEPFIVKFVPLLKSLFPAEWIDNFGVLIGMDAASDNWQGRKDQDQFLGKK